MIISKRAVDAYLRRQCDAFDWMKKLGRGELVQELNRFKTPPRFITDPWLHQLVCVYIGLCEPRFLFLLDMGLGKSKIIMDLIAQSLRAGELRRALITVPRLINIDSWIDDMGKHSDLEPNPVSLADIEAKRDLLLSPKGDVTLIDYQGLHWALCDKVKGKKGARLVRNDKLVRMATRLYNFIGLDESHKLGNHESLWWGIINQLTRTADRVYATTGTLFGGNMDAIWSQFYLVDRGETFGETLGLYRGAFFRVKQHQWKGVEYHFDKKMLPDLNRMLRHRSLRYEDTEVLDLPRAMSVRVPLTMGDEQREHYLRAVEGVINAGGDPRELEAPWIRMRQITSGYLKWNDAHGDHLIYFKDNPKLADLEDRLRSMQDSKVIICYEYTDTGRMISNRLKELGIQHEWLYGGTKDRQGLRRRFLDPNHASGVLLMNSEAGGTGNDGLQDVARYMIFYESPSSVITRKQTERRIRRAGQQRRQFYYDLAFRHSVDQGILDNLKEGRDLYEMVMLGSAKQRRGFLLGY